MPFDEASTDMPENLIPFNQTFVCLFDLILYVPSTILQLNWAVLPGLNQY